MRCTQLPVHSHLGQTLCSEPDHTTETLQVYVQSFGIMSEGDASVVHKVVTPESAPAHPPRQLTVLDVGSTEVMLQWVPPESEDGAISGYRLFYDQEGVDDFTEVEVPSTTCTYNATGLEAGAVYRFQVVAFNEGGDGPETPTLRFKLADGKASPVKPRDGAVQSDLLSRRKASAANVDADAGADVAPVSGRVGSVDSSAAITGTGMEFGATKPASVAAGPKAVVAEPPTAPDPTIASAAAKDKHKEAEAKMRKKLEGYVHTDLKRHSK